MSIYTYDICIHMSIIVYNCHILSLIVYMHPQIYPSALSFLGRPRRQVALCCPMLLPLCTGRCARNEAMSSAKKEAILGAIRGKSRSLGWWL